MTEQTFKVGDRVRITKTYSHGGVLTYEGPVTIVCEDGLIYTHAETYNPTSPVTQTIEKIAPAEPKGIGAVVRDEEGDILVRAPDSEWRGGNVWASGCDSFRWEELSVVEVLSEGIVVE